MDQFSQIPPEILKKIPKPRHVQVVKKMKITPIEFPSKSPRYNPDSPPFIPIFSTPPPVTKPSIPKPINKPSTPPLITSTSSTLQRPTSPQTPPLKNPLQLNNLNLCLTKIQNENTHIEEQKKEYEDKIIQTDFPTPSMVARSTQTEKGEKDYQDYQSELKAQGLSGYLPTYQLSNESNLPLKIGLTRPAGKKKKRKVFYPDDEPNYTPPPPC